MVTTAEPRRPVSRIQAPPPKRWWADAVGVVTLASVVIVVALWLSNDGLQNLDGTGGVAITVGRLAGLVAADLLLLQVLMMARIPWVERSYGQDLLARRHRWLGFTSFWLMLTHVLLTTIGYAQQDRAGLLGETWALVTTYPGMLLATAATALLIAVVGLSIRAARRRLRYESWHLLHLYAYLGVGLALPHEIWTGADFTASGLARAYWWSVYGAALAAVIVFRLGVPLWRSWYHRLVVQAVVPEGHGTVSVYLSGRRLDRLPVRAGQFFLWRFLGGPGWTRAHPYTLSAVPRTDSLRITVKNLGDGSARVARLRPGTRVLVEGPLGAMTSAKRRRRPVLLMAAGVGITTIRALLEDLDLRPGEATLIYRISRPDDAVFRSELDELARIRGARIIYLEGPRGPHGSWLPVQLGQLTNVDGLRWLVPTVAAHEAYLCGPPTWMDTVRTALVATGMPEDHIHTETFGW
jgi:predicted ferric reductase